MQAVSCGEVLRAFKPDANYTDEYNIDNFEELFILWAKEMDDFLDFGRDYRLKDYIAQLTQKYFISQDQKVIYGLDVATNKLICKYILEEQ